MKRISCVSGCFNEEENVEELIDKVTAIWKQYEGIYEFEYILIDNASTDDTVIKLKELAQKDKRIKIIVNERNFGHVRSPYYALLQANGDAVIYLASDLQDPPSLIPEFIKKWEEGSKIVLAVKNQSKESALFFAVRRFYYSIINQLSDVHLIKNATGFGLYDKKVMDIVRKIDDPYPYFRGLICDLGFSIAQVHYTQERRKRGFSKNNFYTLYDVAMLGITNHSKIPLRMAIFFGFTLSGLSLLTAMGYLIAKLLYWEYFTVGTAPTIISIFFFSSVQLFFIGILGEYIGSIHTQILKRPLVVEKERINF